MKDKIKAILFGVLFLVAAACFWFVFDGFTFYISLIPISNEVVGVVCAVIGALTILVGVFDKGEKKEDKE